MTNNTPEDSPTTSPVKLCSLQVYVECALAPTVLIKRLQEARFNPLVKIKWPLRFSVEQ